MNLEDQYQQIYRELNPYLPILGQAADTILDQDVSLYPIFVVSAEPIDMGIPLISRPDTGQWLINASTLEELVTKRIVQEERLDVFRSVYKDPHTHLCLLIFSEGNASIGFMPRKT